MENKLFNEIKDQTLKAIEHAESNQIEECNALLQSRLALLEKLHNNLHSHSNETNMHKEKLIELFHWVQMKDGPVIQQLKDKQEQLKQHFLAQNKTNKAIKHYKNIK
jgi:hypothetical protein